jgi:ABC-type nitrate/sulfonate/bicarbonate transport system permease component
MRLTPRMTPALGRELRDALFSLCSVAGGFLGILWALHHQPATRATPSTTCPGHTARAVHGIAIHCLADHLTRAILAGLLPAFAGLLLGAIVGVMLASLLRLGRRPSRSQARRAR